MGFTGLIFKFALECFHIVSWPLFAIIYPLCASIQAIETNSNSDTEKLISYWICFSLILLFENTFEHLLHWLPYWPYMKLIIVGCLITPHFDGSFYIYNQLVRPCLSSMHPRFVFNWFIKLLDILKETELEARQNLMPRLEQATVLQKAINAVEITQKDGLSTTKPVTQIESVLGQPRIATYAEIVGRNNLPDLITSEKLQKELACATIEAETCAAKSSQELWTCVLCKVKCPRKLNLIAHFQGQRHAKALESLKARPNTKYYFKPWTCPICHVMLENKNNLVSHLQSKRHLAACENQKVEEMSGKGEVSSASSEINFNSPECEAMNLKSGSVVEVRDCKWWCTICNVSCTSEGNMNCHLNGSKHLARTTELTDAAAKGQI
ncbi:uncharacterized protein [Euphorbia lathyris]|uniref:uncharacterized protein n=1 Tax=Euphorbia lathyris TaxID=212925 RepID=UPI003313A52E